MNDWYPEITSEVSRCELQCCEAMWRKVQLWETLCLDKYRRKEADALFNLINNSNCDTEHEVSLNKETHKGNGVHQGLFAGTLTMAPTDPYNEEDMIGAMNKIFSQNTVPVKKWAWYLEYTKNGVPHVHFTYETETGGRIHKKIFQRYWKLWDEPRNQTGRAGFPGGYHAPAKSETAYLEYISKDSGRHKFKGFTLSNEILMDK